MLAPPIDVVTGVPILATGALLPAPVPVETGRTYLITSGSVPSWLAGLAAAIGDSTRVVILALAAPPSASMAIGSGGAGFRAVLAPVAWIAAAGSIDGVALPVDALAPLAPWSPELLLALAPPLHLVARRVVAGALAVARPTPPTGLADALARLRVALGVGAAVADVGAGGSPTVGVTLALARVLVAFPVVAKAQFVAGGSPAVGVAGAFSRRVCTAAIWVTQAHLLAVWSPKSFRTLGVAVCSKISMSTAALVGSDTDFFRFAGEVALTESYRAFLMLLLPPRATHRGRRSLCPAYIPTARTEFLATDQGRYRQEGSPNAAALSLLHCPESWSQYPSHGRRSGGGG